MATKKKNSSKSSKSKKAKESNVVVVDFSKAKGGGGNRRYPEADYKFEFIRWEHVSKKDDPDEKGLRVFLKFAEGKYEGKEIRDNLWLQDNTLWRLRTFLEAMGEEVPDKKAKVNLDKYIGNELGASLVDNEYNNRTTSQVGDYMDLETLDSDPDEDEDDEDEDDEDEDEDDEDEDDEDDDMEDMDVDDDL